MTVNKSVSEQVKPVKNDAPLRQYRKRAVTNDGSSGYKLLVNHKLFRQIPPDPANPLGEQSKTARYENG